MWWIHVCIHIYRFHIVSYQDGLRIYTFFFFFLKFTVFALFCTHTLDSGISGDESQADGGRQKIPGFVVTWLAKRNLNSTAEESLSTLGNTQPSRQDETLAGNVSANR